MLHEQHLGAVGLDHVTAGVLCGVGLRDGLCVDIFTCSAIDHELDVGIGRGPRLQKRRVDELAQGRIDVHLAFLGGERTELRCTSRRS